MAEARGFTEYRSVAISEPLRQGDVLERVSQEPTVWNRHLLVITADCDFAHGKNQGRVTCVPLLTKDEYLLELHIPKIREQVTAKLVTGVQKILRDLGAPNVSESRLRDWSKEQPTEEILSLLSVPEDKKGIVGGILDSIREISETPVSVLEAVNTLVAAQRRLPNAQSETNIRSGISDRLQNAFKQPPGDALFLSALADRYEDGYFAYLRHLEQIWEPQISLGPSRSALEYRRLSRLQENYTYAIAQRFALVFMSIGLPTAYEEMRDFHAALLVEDIK